MRRRGGRPPPCVGAAAAAAEMAPLGDAGSSTCTTTRTGRGTPASAGATSTRRPKASVAVGAEGVGAAAVAVAADDAARYVDGRRARADANETRAKVRDEHWDKHDRFTFETRPLYDGIRHRESNKTLDLETISAYPPIFRVRSCARGSRRRPASARALKLDRRRRRRWAGSFDERRRSSRRGSRLQRPGPLAPRHPLRAKPRDRAAADRPAPAPRPRDRAATGGRVQSGRLLRALRLFRGRRHVPARCGQWRCIYIRRAAQPPRPYVLEEPEEGGHVARRTAPTAASSKLDGVSFLQDASSAVKCDYPFHSQQQGLAVKPTKGDAILFYTKPMDHWTTPRSACPVKGKKMVANIDVEPQRRLPLGARSARSAPHLSPIPSPRERRPSAAAPVCRVLGPTPSVTPAPSVMRRPTLLFPALSSQPSKKAKLCIRHALYTHPRHLRASAAAAAGRRQCRVTSASSSPTFGELP